MNPMDLHITRIETVIPTAIKLVAPNPKGVVCG